MRRLAILLAPLLLGCPRSGDSGSQAPAVDPAREPDEGSGEVPAGAPEPVVEEPAATPTASTPVTMAAQQGLIFRRAGDRCEVWNFGEDGLSATQPFIDAEGEARKRAAMSEWQRRKADVMARSNPPKRPDARLSYAYTVVDGEVVLASPEVKVEGLSRQLACDAAGGRWYMEESDCEQERDAVELGGCGDAFTEEARVAVFAELGRALEAGKEEAKAQAKARLDAFKRKLPSGASVYWLTEGEGGRTCQRWRRGRDALVRRSSEGKVSYGFRAQLSRLSLAEVHLTGPSFSGPSGSGGLGDLDVRPIHDVQGDRARVGEETWYFTEAACQRAAKSDAP